MKGYVITIKDNEVSNTCANNLIESNNIVGNDIVIDKYDATTPDNYKPLMKHYHIQWTYPWEHTKLDLKSGLLLVPYRTAVPEKRIACFLSHYRLWVQCVETNESMFIFEHDAIFTDKVDVDQLVCSKYGIIGLNNPIGATRKSKDFYDIMRNSPLPIISAPKVDDDQIPQGLAGNSAYFIKPSAALKLLYATKQYGAWPNDALMCKQLLPNVLGVTTKTYTGLQRIQSTTTL